MLMRFSLFFLLCGLAFTGSAEAAPSAASQWLHKQNPNGYVLQIMKVQPSADKLLPYSDFRTITQALPQGRVLVYTSISNKKRFYHLGLAVFDTAQSAQVPLPPSWPQHRVKVMTLQAAAKASGGKLKVFKPTDPRLKKLFKHEAKKRVVQPPLMKPKKPIKKAVTTTQSTPPAPSALFIEVGLGIAAIDDGAVSGSLQQRGHRVTSQSDSTASLMQLGLGYQLNPRWAAVLGFVKTQSVETSINLGNTAGSAALASDIQAFTPHGFNGVSVAGRYSMPLNNWSLLAELGLLSWQAEKEAILQADGTALAAAQKLSGTDGVVGFEVEYLLSKDWRLGAKYQYFSVAESTSAASVNLQYRWR